MEKKYKLLVDDTVRVDGRTLYRIEALRDFADVRKGDKGGYVESEDNLSHVGNCWVFGNAWVAGDAYVYGNARVYGYAEVYGDAEVRSTRDYAVLKNIWSSGRYFTYTRSNRMWKVGCFYGTGRETD